MLRITISTDNAAFEDKAAECARILRLAAEKISADGSGKCTGNLLDGNGNHVGTFTVS